MRETDCSEGDVMRETQIVMRGGVMRETHRL